MLYKVNIYRDSNIESQHSVLVTDLDSEKGFNLYLRSSFKPFQLLPFVANGGIEEFGLDDSALAIFTSSHSGEEQHTDLLMSILKKFNIDEELLFCKPHWPLNAAYSSKMAAIGNQPSRIHNNCSGKHISMLLMCKLFGFSTDMYFDKNHKLQKLVFEYLSNIFHIKIDDIGIDGCSTPIPFLNSKIIVDSANQLSKGHGDNSLAWNKIIHAMKKNPYLVAGTGRFDSILMDKADGNLMAKVGAEGVILLQSDEKTIIMKALDGGRRGVELLASHFSKENNFITDYEFEIEKEVIYNKQNELVGHIEITK